MTIQTAFAVEGNTRLPVSIPSRRCPNCGEDGAGDWLNAPDRFHGRQVWYTLVHCAECSLIWLENPPVPEEMAAHYGPDYDRLIAQSGERSPEHWTSRRDALLRYKTGGRLLDLGCSSGSFLNLLKGKEWELYGVEISEESARKAKERTGAKIFVGDVLEAPFAPESFDAITCFHVFEHMYQPKEVLKKAWEWLKPGGVFLAIMPNIDCSEARFYKSYWYPLELPRHLFHFSPTSLDNMVRSVGFKDVKISTSRAPFIEYHIHYLMDELYRKMGRSRRPASVAGDFSLAWRIFRKMLRLTLYPLLVRATSLWGHGQIMQVVVVKPETR